MEINEYQRIIKYLERKELLDKIEEKENRKRIKRKLEKYELKEGKLYRKNRNRRIIPRYDLEVVLYLGYNDPIAGHLRSEKCYNKLKEKYYWKQMKEDIEQYIKSCDQCQRRGKSQGKNELHSIKVKEPFY